MGRTKTLMISVFVLLAVTPAVASASDGGASAISHRMMVLAIQVGLILVAARLGNILFEKLRLPGVLGELAAGMIIGPYALGQISVYGFSQGIFGDVVGAFPVSPELYGLASLAAIILLFVAGLETDIRLLMRYSIAGTVVGVGGVITSFVLGDLTAVVFSDLLFGGPQGFFAPPCLFLGVISTATSVGITARILSAKRKMDSPEGVTILSGAVIDDVLGIIMLAIVTGMVSAGGGAKGGGVDWERIGIIAAKATGVWLAATALGLLASRKISFLLKRLGERSSIAVIALGMTMILAGMFEEAGLAMIIGAYVMGLTLSKTDVSHVVREKVHNIYEFFVPVFFCVMGMLINFRAMASLNILTFGLVYSAVAIVAKLLGCGLPALMLNFNRRGAARIGTGMVPRGEVALIIAGFALSKGFLSQDVFAAAIIMTFVTTIIAPQALVLLFRSSASGVRREVEARKTTTTITFDFPSIETTEFLAEKLRSVLELEGFFVNSLSSNQQHYQARKDTVIIDLEHSDSRLTISCNDRDIPLVHTAVSEAAAALEQTLRGLKEPIDLAVLRTSVQQDTAVVAHHFHLRAYLTPLLVEPGLKGSTKDEIIDELLEILRRNNLVRDIEEARKAVLLREESMSTGLQHGVAIPHGRTNAVNRLVCAVGVKADGVDFKSFDGEPAQIFVLTLSPLDKPAPHVQLMAAVSQILNEEGRRRVLAAKTPRQLYDVLSMPV